MLVSLLKIFFQSLNLVTLRLDLSTLSRHWLGLIPRKIATQKQDF